MKIKDWRSLEHWNDVLGLHLNDNQLITLSNLLVATCDDRFRCGATYATIHKEGERTLIFPAEEIVKIRHVAAFMGDSLRRFLTAAAAIAGTRIEFDGRSHSRSALTADQKFYAEKVCREFGDVFGYPEYWDLDCEVPFTDRSLQLLANELARARRPAKRKHARR